VKIADDIGGGRQWRATQNDLDTPQTKYASSDPHLHSQYQRFYLGGCHKRQKPQAPTPLAPIRNRQTRKVAKAKDLNRNTNLT